MLDELCKRNFFIRSEWRPELLWRLSGHEQGNKALSRPNLITNIKNPGRSELHVIASSLTRLLEHLFKTSETSRERELTNELAAVRLGLFSSHLKQNLVAITIQ